MKKSTSPSILIDSESLKKAGTSKESDHVASPPQHAHAKPLGKQLLKTGKKN